MSLARSMWYYVPIKDDSELIDKLSQLAEQLPHRGIDEYYGRLRHQGYLWGRKRVLRVYRLMKLQLRRKRKRRLPSRIKFPLTLPIATNIIWSMDFMHDVLEDGRKFRVLNIMDDYNREAIATEPEHSYPAERVVRLLDYITESRGTPDQIRVDNGSEFISHAFRNWCTKKDITIKYIQPGKPTQNAYIERFNRYFREDVLDAYIFRSIDEVKELSEKWRQDYNHYHPHKSLMGMSPIQFKKARSGASP